MRGSDQELIRQVLSSILERLGEDARVETRVTGGASPRQGSDRQRPGLDANERDGGADNSIILVVMNQFNKSDTGVRRASGQPAGAHNRTESTVQLPYETQTNFDGRGTEATHPVFERFPIAEEETAPPAPKTCFMEPGRVCVNSGACEMRGY